MDNCLYDKNVNVHLSKCLRVGTFFMLLWTLPVAVPFLYDSSTYNGVISGICIGSMWIIVFSSLSYSLVYNYIILNILMNAFVHLYLAFCVVFINLETLYLSITFILIYILEARCTHTHTTNTCCTHNIVLYFVNLFV